MSRQEVMEEALMVSRLPLHCSDFTASQYLSLSFPSTPSPYTPAHLSRLTHPPPAGGGVLGCGGGPAPARCA